MRMLRAASLAVLTLLFVGDGDPHRAGAACHQVRDCSERDHYDAREFAGLSCAALARIRDAVAAKSGSCLRSGAWRGTFSGRDCRHAGAVSPPPGRTEQDKAHAIRRAERAKGCGGA